MANDNAKKRIVFGCDHAGYEIREDIIAFLRDRGYDVVDCGSSGPGSVDYPVIADTVCKAVQSDPSALAVLICGTGIGMSIAANKHTGIRAAVCWNEECASLARRHNNANVICLGARMLTTDKIKEIIDAFLNASFEGGRHQKRVDMLDGSRD